MKPIPVIRDGKIVAHRYPPGYFPEWYYAGGDNARVVEAPEEFRVADGANWYLRSALSQKPWEAAVGPPERQYPEGFAETFADIIEPIPGDVKAEQQRRGIIEGLLSNFLGVPGPQSPVVDQDGQAVDLGAAAKQFRKWGLGTPKPYFADGVHGPKWFVHFPDTKYRSVFGPEGVDAGAAFAAVYTAQFIAQWQARVWSAGVTPAEGRFPWLAAEVGRAVE